jgi:hypothetical protein
MVNQIMHPLAWYLIVASFEKFQFCGPAIVLKAKRRSPLFSIVLVNQIKTLFGQGSFFFPVDLLREWTKRVVCKANIAFLHFGWTRGTNKVVSGPQYHGWKQIQIWILTCWYFLTVGILLGSWWAYYELACFRSPYLYVRGFSLTL